MLLVLDGALEIFVDAYGRELGIFEAGPGSTVGELAVLGETPRSASVLVSQPSAVLYWGGEAFRSLLLGDSFLSRELFSASIRTLIKHERLLIDRLARAEAGRPAGQGGASGS